jgi:hypothetical protein
MKKIMLTLFVLGFTASNAAHALTLTCSDASGKLQYTTYLQQGGACCGGSSMSLSYNGVVLKQVEMRFGMGSLPGAKTDSNLALTVQEGTKIDLGNSSTNPATNSQINFIAMNLTLQSTSASPVIPDGMTTAVVSVVCEEDANLFPVP